MMGNARTDDDAENDDDSPLVNEGRQTDDSAFSIGEGVVHVHTASNSIGKNEGGSIVDRLWNQFFGNACNISMNGSTPKGVDTTLDDSVDCCGHKSEMEAFNSAVQVLLRNKSIQSDLRPDDQYSSIPHCEQLERWDCGIACIIMILRWLRDDQNYPKDSTLNTKEKGDRAKMLEIIQTESVWTADLVLLIDQLFKPFSQKNHPCLDRDQQPQHSYLFCSKTLAVDVGLRDFSYYQAAFLQDQARVTEKFQELGRLGSNTLRLDHLPLAAVLNVVAHSNCVAIVLVDNSTLFSTSSSHDTNFSRQGGIFAALGLHAPQKETFAGHYVILCGISTNPDDVQMAQSFDRETYINGGCYGSEDDAYCLVLLDPAPRYASKVLVTPQRFERGWRATGTDDDIIFIAKHAILT